MPTLRTFAHALAGAMLLTFGGLSAAQAQAPVQHYPEISTSPEWVRASDPVQVTLELSTPWLAFEADARPDKLVFQRYAVEGNTYRAVFVLACQKGHNVAVLEVIPPKQMVAKLEKFVGSANINGQISFIYGDTAINFAADIDQIAGFIDFKPEEVGTLLSDLAEPDFKVFFFNSRFGYGFRQTLDATSKIRALTQRPDVVRASGKAQILSWREVQARCVRFLGK